MGVRKMTHQCAPLCVLFWSCSWIHRSWKLARDSMEEVLNANLLIYVGIPPPQLHDSYLPNNGMEQSTCAFQLKLPLFNYI